jgi:hypothetical protein
MRRISMVLVSSSLISLLLCGCSLKSPPPLTYLALERPSGPIHTAAQTPLKKDFPRGGWYFGNDNFRPAPDIASYIKQSHAAANTKVLKNADIQLNVPFAFDILFFGYNSGTDTVTAK